jgi:rSAM/selenodomain-associated transferase 2
MLSIVVPTLNEASVIATALARLEPLRQSGAEVIVADGGSDDGTVALARPLADRVVEAPRGRGSQMNAGAAAAAGDMLLFLHADTILPDGADALISAHHGHAWGRFDVRIEGDHPLLRLVAAMMNLRSRLTGVCTGDQAIFVRRAIFVEVGGYPDIPLMEDIALSKALRRRAAPLCLARRVTTSGRRWQKRGALRTILLMWRLRFDYWRGVDPRALAIRYGYRPR